MQQNFVVSLYCLLVFSHEKSTSQQNHPSLANLQIPCLGFPKTSRLRHLGPWGLYCNHISRLPAMPKLFVPVSFLFFFFFNFTVSHDVMWRGVTGWWLLLLVFNILKSLFESEDHQYGSAFWNLPKRQWNWQKYIVYWAWHISFFLLMRSVLR